MSTLDATPSEEPVPPVLFSPMQDNIEPPSGGVLNYISTTPRSEVGLKSGSKKLSSSSTYAGAFQGQRFEYLGQIPEDASGRSMFLKKVEQCRTQFVWMDEYADLQQKNAKRQTLLDISDYLAAYPDILEPKTYKALVRMLEENLFRSLPPKLNPFGDPWLMDEDEPVLDLAWPHLEPCYEVLLRMLEAPSFNRKRAKPYFRPSFARNIVALFDSEDPRERDCLRMCLHRLYGRLFHLRPVLREEFLNTFVTFAQYPRFSGIAELLEVYGSIVNGLAVPLKKGHALFLTRVLLPMLKLPSLGAYIGQLTYCMLHFVQKNAALVDDICRYTFVHWPLKSARAQVLLLGMLEDVAQSMDMTTLLTTGISLIEHLNRHCISSIHYQVADRGLALLECPKIQELCRRKSERVIPILYHTLQGISRGAHWHPGLQAAAFKKLGWLTKLNPSVTQACASGVSLTPGDGEPNTWAKLHELELEVSPADGEDRKVRNKLWRKSGLPLDEDTYKALLKYVKKDSED